MSQISFDVFIDESGDFETESLSGFSSPSLVGGLLIPSGKISEAYLNMLVPGAFHAMENYDKEKFFCILKKLRADKGHFIIFRNEERLNVVNGDMTYLNVLSEGFVQLIRNLKIMYPDDNIILNALIAYRQAVSFKRFLYGEEEAKEQKVRINQDQYYARLDEKMIIAMGRNQIQGVKLNTSFAGALQDKRLMLADIICNTFFSKSSRKKFTDEDRQLIDTLYEERFIYSVFENATVGNLKRLFIESRYGEMLYQICILPSLAGVLSLRNHLLKRIANESYKERDIYFSYMSLQISQYNNFRLFKEGIKLAENYKKYVLMPLRAYALPNVSEAEQIAYSKQVAFWMFDADFYILTMYDHLGNPVKCAEYLDLCRSNISAVNQAWEHVDYYLTYCIRELNCLIGQFEFKKVIERTDQLLKILQDAKELFSLIGVYDNTGTEAKSELLGKVYGVRLEAFLNLISEKPEYFSKALEASDAAIAEFSLPEDLRRQYQYRCQLMVEARMVEESIESLIRSFGEENNQSRDYCKLAGMIYKNRKRPAIFSLFHYSNVMNLLVDTKHPDAIKMYKALIAVPGFIDDLKNDERAGHPWNLVIWNMCRCCRSFGKVDMAEKLYKKAMAITQEDPDNITMYSFSVSMAAENLLYCIRNNTKAKSVAEHDYVKACAGLHKNKLPAGIAAAFPEGRMDETTLKKVARKYLK